VFFDKFQAQGWLDLFANSQMGHSVPNLADLYANCDVTSGVVTSVVNGKSIKFNAISLGEILRIPTKGFRMYVREDKSVLTAARLLELAQKLSQQPSLKAPWTDSSLIYSTGGRRSTSLLL